MLKVRASQVFTRTVEKAVTAKKDLDNGLSFIDTVEKYSDCPSKNNQGDLGWVNDSNLGALLGDSLTQDDKGKILGPIHSQYGYHILMITDIEIDKTVDNDIHPIPFISPANLQRKIESRETMVILDIREPWEQDIAKIDEAKLISRENCESILEALEKDAEIILIDWKGERASSFRVWLQQRGFNDVKSLQGGIDAWTVEINTELNRYDIDEDDGYRYEDVLPEN